MIEEWGQTEKSVTFSLNVGLTSIKKLDITVYDLLVKVNNKEKKEALIVDLYAEVDTKRLSHSARLQGKKLKITCKKSKPEIWPNLQPIKGKYSKDQMRLRRAESFRRRER